MKPIKVGIVGLGRAGFGMHCSELKGRESRFEIVAACDILPERVEKMTKRYGCKGYVHIDDLIADPQVELVDIATRSAHHFEHAMLTLTKGKDVFLEKPITLDYDQAVRLQAQASRSGSGRLFIRHNRRFDNDFLHVQEIIASGILGDVYEIRLARHGYSRRDDWQTIISHGGGQLLNWGPHIIDHALRFIDGPIVAMYSNLQRIAAVGDAEDHVKIVLQGENGMVVDLEISGGVAIGAPKYLVFGTKGSLRLSGDQIQIKYLDPNVRLSSKTADPGTPENHFGNPEELPWVEEMFGVKPQNPCNIWDALYLSMREQKEFPIRLEQAIAVMEVIDKAKTGTEFAFA